MTGGHKASLCGQQQPSGIHTGSVVLFRTKQLHLLEIHSPQVQLTLAHLSLPKMEGNLPKRNPLKNSAVTQSP